MQNYFYNGQLLALELNGENTFSVFRVEGQVLGELIKNEMYADVFLSAVDQQSSVLKARGARCYSAYGYDVLASRESLIGFNGEHRDGASGCDLLGQGLRAFSPILMRFCSPDTLSPFAEGGLNTYAYCEGDPVNFADPEGKMKMRPPFGINYRARAHGISTIGQRMKRARLENESRAQSSGGSPQYVGSSLNGGNSSRFDLGSSAGGKWLQQAPQSDESIVANARARAAQLFEVHGAALDGRRRRWNSRWNHEGVIQAIVAQNLREKYGFRYVISLRRAGLIVNLKRSLDQKEYASVISKAFEIRRREKMAKVEVLR